MNQSLSTALESAAQDIPPVKSVTWRTDLIRLAAISTAMLIAAAIIVPPLAGRSLSSLIAGNDILVESVNGSVIASRGETVTFAFRVQNVSGHRLTLLGVQASCGCVTPLDEFPASMEPNDVKLVEFNTVIGAPNEQGDFTRHARLFVDNAEIVPLLLTARVK